MTTVFAFGTVIRIGALITILFAWVVAYRRGGWAALFVALFASAVLLKFGEAPTFVVTASYLSYRGDVGAWLPTLAIITCVSGLIALMFVEVPPADLEPVGRRLL